MEHEASDSPASGIRKKADELGLTVNADLLEYALEVDTHCPGCDPETRRSCVAPVTFADF